MISQKKLRKLLLFFIFVLSFGDLFAQGSGNKYAGEFLAIGVGGRPLGMGGTYVALANDVTAGYWNPALLSKIDYPQFSLMHDWQFGNLVNYNYAAIAFPYGKKSSIGLSFIMMGIDDISDTRNALIDLNGNGILDPGERLDPDKITLFNSTDMAFYLTYAKKQTENFSYGANLKVIHRSLAEATAWGFGLDVGLSYTLFNKWLFGANLQDLTTTYLSWSTGKKEVITPTCKLGTAYLIPFWKGVLSPAVDVDVRFENRQTTANAYIGPVSFDMHAGMEYNFQNIFSLRAGYNDVGNLTVGAGIKLPKINIDYSFAKFDSDESLGNSHRISLIFTLDDQKYQRK